MKTLKLPSVFAIGLAVFIAACQSNATTADRPTSLNASWTEVIPIDVERFIRNNYRDPIGKRPIVLIVEYPLPYPRYFNFLRFGDDNAVSEWRVVPDWAFQGASSGVLTESEKADVLNSIEVLDPILSPKIVGQTDAEQDKFIIWFSYATPDGYELLSCSGRYCPQEICTLYEIANYTFKRHQETGFLSCPASQQ